MTHVSAGVRMQLIDLWPRLLSCRQIDAVHPDLARAMSLEVDKHTSVGLVTCDQDDALYVALDEATKHARIDVVFARSFYAGSKHASGPLSGEVLGIIAASNPDDVAEGLWVLKEHLRVVRFQTLPGDNQPAFLAHVVPELGASLAAQVGMPRGEPMAYLIAPPLESMVAVDAALKAADVKLAKHIPPPSETNFGGAFLSGELAALEAARDAFVEAIVELAAAPLRDARRPQRLRR